MMGHVGEVQTLSINLGACESAQLSCSHCWCVTVKFGNFRIVHHARHPHQHRSWPCGYQVMLHTVVDCIYFSVPRSVTKQPCLVTSYSCRMHCSSKLQGRAVPVSTQPARLAGSAQQAAALERCRCQSSACSRSCGIAKPAGHTYARRAATNTVEPRSAAQGCRTAVTQIVSASGLEGHCSCT